MGVEGIWNMAVCARVHQHGPAVFWEQHKAVYLPLLLCARQSRGPICSRVRSKIHPDILSTSLSGGEEQRIS